MDKNDVYKVRILTDEEGRKFTVSGSKDKGFKLYDLEKRKCYSMVIEEIFNLNDY